MDDLGNPSKLSDLEKQIERLPKEEREALLGWLFDCIDAQAPRANLVAEAYPAYAEPAARAMTVEEYFEFEEKATLRHEYINGAVYAMSGPSVVHNRITFQLATALSGRLRGGPCKVFLNDLMLKLELGQDQIVYYPDVMVACRPKEWGKNFVRNPKLVAEVLSPSTQHIDRREKALNYHRTQAIEEYLVLSQTEKCVLVHRRADRWELETVHGSEAVVELRSLGTSVALAEVYGDVL
jgi:Uma2 family endonuclease